LLLFITSISLFHFILSFTLQTTIWVSLVLAYLPSYLDGSERRARGRPWVWFIHLGFWKWFLPGNELIYSEALDPKRLAIVCAFPHGILSYCHASLLTDGMGWFSKKVHDTDKRDIGASVVFKIPIMREISLWLALVDAGKRTCIDILQSGKSLYVVPGGEMEQMLTIEGRHRVYLNSRKGFVRLAVEFGADLVPNYAFGETDLYSVSSFLLPLRLWICRKFYIALPIFYSKRWGIPIPFLRHKNVRYCLCVGKPIQVKKVSPNDPQFNEYIDTVHEEFKQGLKSLFEEKKKECGYPDAVLEII